MRANETQEASMGWGKFVDTLSQEETDQLIMDTEPTHFVSDNKSDYLHPSDLSHDMLRKLRSAAYENQFTFDN